MPLKFKPYVEKWMGVVADCVNGTFKKYVGESLVGIQVNNNDDYRKALARMHGVSYTAVYQKLSLFRKIKDNPAIPAKRYFTIGEVSDLCAVKPHVLRYWEQEFTQLKPVKRRGNRRYYQHHEVLLIRRIRELLYEQGFTINGARNRLDELRHGAGSVPMETAPEAEAPVSAPMVGFGTTPARRDARVSVFGAAASVAAASSGETPVLNAR